MKNAIQAYLWILGVTFWRDNLQLQKTTLVMNWFEIETCNKNKASLYHMENTNHSKNQDNVQDL
jgi:hypothetical protein